MLLQVNVWALHDPYAVLGEEKPFRPGELQDSLCQVFRTGPLSRC